MHGGLYSPGLVELAIQEESATRSNRASSFELSVQQGAGGERAYIGHSEDLRSQASILGWLSGGRHPHPTPHTPHPRRSKLTTPTPHDAPPPASGLRRACRRAPGSRPGPGPGYYPPGGIQGTCS